MSGSFVPSCRAISQPAHQLRAWLKTGRLVISKPVPDQMRLREGSQLSVEVVGDRIELCHDADDVQLQKRGKRRVIVGWDGFDAAEAVNEAREQRLDHLASSQDA